MTDKQKIFLIYASVAVASVFIMAIAFLIRGKPSSYEAEAPYYKQEQDFEPLLKLEQDLVLKKQNGEEVRISDLNGKVWAFAQFYAVCPMCAERNSQGLKQLYEKYKDEPDFQVVCITVDPENDGVEQMKSYAEALNADVSNWWFLTGEADALKKYMVDEMKYQEIVKREDEEAAARLGAYEHDMSIAIYDRKLSMVKRHDLFNAKKKGESFYKGEVNKLHHTVETLLNRE